MDNAPPVTYPVGRTARLGWLLAGLWLVGAGAVLEAFFSASALVHQGFNAMLLAVSIVISAAACLAFWRGQRARTLLWDGERWSLEPAGAGCGDLAQARVRMDFQRAMLLSLEQPQPPRRRVWLWAEAAHDPARWHLLPCALYSSTLSLADQPPVDEYA